MIIEKLLNLAICLFMESVYWLQGVPPVDRSSRRFCVQCLERET